MPRLLTTRISRLIETIAWITSMLVVVLPPLIYFLILHENIYERAARDAEVQAVLVGRFVGRSPDSWRYSAERLHEALQDILNPGNSTSIHDMAGQLITEIKGDDHWPLVRPSAAFYEFGQPVGRVTVVASLWTALQRTLFVAALSLLAALGLMLPLARITLRTLKQASSALESSEKRFERAMEATADGIWEQDLTSNRLLYVSPHTEELLGYAPGSFVRADFDLKQVFFDPAERERSRLALAEHIRTGTHYVSEARLSHRDGTLRWMRFRGQVTRNTEGHADRLVGSLRDITEEHRIEEQRAHSLARFEALIQNTPLVVAISLDRDLNIRLWNRAAERFFGLTARQALGCRVRDLLLVAAEGENFAEILDQVWQTGIPYGPRETMITFADGQRWILSAVFPLLDDGQVREVFLMGVDVTDRIGMEEELRQHRDHLQDLVASQTADLVRAKEVAERANESKSEFLANMSHELRTPMHAILSFARIGHFKAATAPPDKLKGYFEHIRASGERLLDLVNDLLDLSKLEAGRMQYVMMRVDLRRCAAGVMAELAPLFEGKQLSCSIEATAADCHVTGDHKRMEQVVRNLLGNAIKFTPPGKCISITIAADVMSLGRRANDANMQPALCLSVADEGIGIPETELDSVFDKFTQSSLTSSGAGGTGLGLAICREIVHAHRGIIRASNRATGGAVFDVLLPLPEKDLS